ncbi:AGE family epimerase/isomerase [Flavimaricola marinus]|uniref:Cellobiose 2-epimerase n=1 Tax=Flavimaricola marinus TaxID=1819565 RepID=A0A238LLP7_9RHOB|nr:AGE family epimerase/isomerase [Flavimaricola marinus]SMY09770.1 Cellobiose 2-epimerase [Flavimaricola marinus]
MSAHEETGLLTPNVDALQQTLLDDILPVWIDAGWDTTTGHFHEALSLDGNPLTSDRLRIRTAARMIHVYADAARLGCGPDGGLAAAVRAADAIERDAKRVGGGYVHEIARNSGKITDPKLDLYDQSCMILAFASLHHATGDPVYQAKADDTLAVIDRGLASSSGGWREDNAGSLPRRQNPHMHMFEALSALYAATGATPYRARLSGLINGLTTHFLSPEGLLVEFMGPYWEQDARYGSHRLDPGHMAEWAWLLRDNGPADGLAPPDLPNRLLATAIDIGRDPNDQRFLLDEVDASGRHVGKGRRLWSQVEYIKGCLVTGRLNDAEVTARGILETYLAGGTRGLWHDAMTAKGRPVDGPAPASSCYHLWTMVAGITDRRSLRAAP